MRRAIVPLAVVLLGATAAQADERHDVVVLASGGLSAARDRPVRNFAPPAVEVRYGYRLSPLLLPDVGLALVAFPEEIPQLRVGLRMYPGTLLGDGFAARSLFVRAAVETLLVVDGFDCGAGGEIGFAPSHARLLGYLAVATHRTFVGPRIIVEARVGVGFRF